MMKKPRHLVLVLMVSVLIPTILAARQDSTAVNSEGRERSEVAPPAPGVATSALKSNGTRRLGDSDGLGRSKLAAHPAITQFGVGVQSRGIEPCESAAGQGSCIQPVVCCSRCTTVIGIFACTWTGILNDHCDWSTPIGCSRG